MNQKGFIPLVGLFVVLLGIATATVILTLGPFPISSPRPTPIKESGFGQLLHADVILPTPSPSPKLTEKTPTSRPTQTPQPTPITTSTPQSTPTPTTNSSCSSYNDALSFREFIFCAFGFNAEAASRIRNTTKITVRDLNSTSGGGAWYVGERKVELFTVQREAAVHELSHAFWEDERGDTNRRLQLVKDLIKLATLDKNSNSQYLAAINFAHEYVYGAGNWKGMFCAYDQMTCVGKDSKLLSDGEIIDFTNRWIILDHEIYAGFSSWTMGKFFQGPRILPAFMANHFTEQFSGNIKATPYYEGGSP